MLQAAEAEPLQALEGSFKRESVLLGHTFRADLPELELVKRWTSKASQVIEQNASDQR